jgi:hypothetical protein
VHDPSRRSFARFADGLRFLLEALYFHGGLAAIGALLFLPLFGLGRELGVPYLYWHDSLPIQAAVGTTMGLVYWHLGIVAYTLAVAKPGVIPEREGDKDEVRRYIHVALGPLLLVLFGAAISMCYVRGTFETGVPPRAQLPPHAGLPWLAGLLASYAITSLLLRMLGRTNGPAWLVGLHVRLDAFTSWIWTVAHRLTRGVDRILSSLGFDERTAKPSAHLEGLRDANEQRRRVFGLMMFFSSAMSLTWLAMSAWTRSETFHWMPAAIPYCLTLGLVAGIYGVLRMAVRRLTLPVLLGVLLFCGWQVQQFPNGTAMPSNCDSAVDPRECEDLWSSPRSFRERSTSHAASLVSDEAALAAQLARRSGPIVVITTSGGGIRSAAWTVAVFNQLQQLDPEFFEHVRLVTGASGGMLGAAHWIASSGQAQLDGRSQPDAGGLFCAASTNSLYAPLSNLLLFTPFSDRGEALELAWERESPALALPLHTFAPLEARGQLPSLVFAPMLIEDGSQMLMGNLDLDWYALADHPSGTVEPPGCSIDAGLRNAEGACSNARQLFARVPGETVKISTIARVAASFPYVSPAVTLPFDEHPRAVDAGYYDNYGTKLAVAWITHHTIGCHTTELAACLDERPILLLELRDHDPDRWIEPRVRRAILHELSSPIEALFKAQLHVANHRNAAIVDELMRSLGDQLEHIVLHFDGEASLSWELTQADRRELWLSAQSEGSWTRLHQWWSRHKPTRTRSDAPAPTPACLPQ